MGRTVVVAEPLTRRVERRRLGDVSHLAAGKGGDRVDVHGPSDLAPRVMVRRCRRAVPT
jgi:hypothetical protein